MLLAACLLAAGLWWATALAGPAAAVQGDNPVVASTAPPPPPGGGEPAPAGGEGGGAEHGEMSHVDECVLEAVEAGGKPEDCLEAPNPILPETSELVWGTISFSVLLFLLAKFAFPAVKKGMDARAEKIRSSLDEADAARTEAQQILSDYKSQLADAKNEAARIIDEARQAADRLRQDLKSQAEEEMAEIKQRAQDDIKAQASRTMASLRSEVAQLALQAAERVVERNLDRDTNMALIDRFIEETTNGAGTGASRST